MPLLNRLRELSFFSWLCLAALALVLTGLIMLPVDTVQREFVARTGGVLAAAAMLLFVLRLPPETRSIWLLFWMYLFNIVVADIIYGYQQLATGELQFPGPADVVYMLAYGYGLAGLVMLSRRIDPSRNFEVAIDSIIIGLAVLTLVGSKVILPMIEAAEAWDLGLVMSIAYPVMDVFILAALVRVNLLSPVRYAAILSLSAAMLTFLLLDLAYYYNLYVVGTELDIEIPWMIALALMAAAAGMPSAGQIATRVLQDEVKITQGRLAFVAVSVMVPLAVIIVDHLRSDEVRALWTLSLGIAVVLLVLWRGYQLLKTTQRQHSELRLLAQAEAEARQQAVAARQAADAANIAKSQFLSVMSHELRTPLNTIMGMFELIQRSGNAQQSHDLATRGLKSSEHLLELVTEILDLSSIEAGRLTLVSEPFDLKTLIGDVSEMALIRRAAGVTFKVNIDDALARRKLLGDAMRLKQVLINLLGNAFKFTERGGVVFSVHQVGGTPDAPVLEFTVADSGIGMSTDQVSRLFRPFTQLDMRSTRRFGGTGLGLVISQRLVELMGGEPITVESRPGAGSRFAFSLAFEAVAEASELMEKRAGAPTAPAAGRLSGYRLLLVEDNEDSRFIMHLILENEGATVDEAEDGYSAISAALAAATPYDAVLMDMRMPGKDGLASTRELRAKGYTGIVIALTANAYDRDRDDCLAAGMNDFATKPLKIDELVKKIERHRSADGVAGRAPQHTQASVRGQKPAKSDA